MFNSISWQQYVLAVLLLLFLYYGYVLLRFFRQEISCLMSGKEKQVAPDSNAASLVIMGPARPDTGTATFQANELMFAEPDDVPEQLTQSAQEELLSESITLMAAFQDAKGKAEFLELFFLLFYKYRPFKNEIKLEESLLQIRDQAADLLPFKISASEWPHSWDAE
jgi:hypothetical protein